MCPNLAEFRIHVFQSLLLLEEKQLAELEFILKNVDRSLIFYEVHKKNL